MTATTDATSVVLEIAVDVPADHAFATFHSRFDAVKPRDHNLLDVDIAETVFEPRVGGHVYDRGVDGSECRWARVLVFDPPRRVVISWDIGPRWELEADPARCSEVEVTFTPDGPERTTVRLEHRHLDRHGEGWQAARDQVAAEGGWPLYLDRFRETLAR